MNKEKYRFIITICFMAMVITVCFCLGSNEDINILKYLLYYGMSFVLSLFAYEISSNNITDLILSRGEDNEKKTKLYTVIAIILFIVIGYILSC